jgi:intracellular sulfur oxidation DsrE/DsrF family protein
MILMKKSILFLTFLVLISARGFAQDSTITGQHRIIFQVQTGDTLAHKALMKQLNNIATVSPETKVEVLCHGPGLDILVSDQTTVYKNMVQLKAKGISFVACEFSMAERKVSRERIISEATTVKYGILEIVSKQEQGWSYIKAGF